MWWPAVVPLRLDYGRSPHAYVNQRLQIELELLMMSGMPLETCWAFNEWWTNKFYYKDASCWLFLLSEKRIWYCNLVMIWTNWSWKFYKNISYVASDTCSPKLESNQLIQRTPWIPEINRRGGNSHNCQPVTWLRINRTIFSPSPIPGPFRLHES